MAEAHWDAFHSDRLEVERGLTTAEVRRALARGDLRDDDLIRPAGTTEPWAPLADRADFHQAAAGGADAEMEAETEDDGAAWENVEAYIEAPPTEPEPEAEAPDATSFFSGMDEDEYDVLRDEPPAATARIAPDDESADESAGFPRADGKTGADLGALDLNPRRIDPGPRPHELPTFEADEAWDELEVDEAEEEEYDPQEEDEAAAEFTLARGGPETVEELDLAAMVDVAFQLVLFFLVTATTVLYKSLEVPRPNPENAPAAATQAPAKSLEELKDEFILVEIDPAGLVKIDREPVDARHEALVGRLRAARETGRQSMLLTADFATPHRSAVLAYDAANEIGLGIAIARPAPKP